MNIFKSQSDDTTFSFNDSDNVSGFSKVGEYDGDWGFGLPQAVLDIMVESSPSIVRWEAPVQPSRTASMLEWESDAVLEETAVQSREPQIIGYSYTVVEI